MSKQYAAICRKTPFAVSKAWSLVLVIGTVGLLAAPAESRERHHRHRHAASHTKARVERSDSSSAGMNFAAIVVDANSGRTLYARNENEFRRPASITKVMTLYLLFEQLEKGRLRLDSAIPISVHAAAQAPTKLGLRPGASITVDNAIQAVVTRSANDIAVAIAEAIAGDEATFADMMTKKARALGMTRTNFANASGLPQDEQVTTAADLALLGRAIQDHFPRYYRYFATQTFHYGGVAIRNHNHLLERVEGMDGIKTGYTRASGFNLLASVKRSGRHIVAVVLGGRSAAGRDRIMAGLIEDHLPNGSNLRLAAATPALSESAPVPAPKPATKPAHQEATPDQRHVVQPDRKLPFVPVSLRPGLTVDAAPVGSISLANAVDRPRPAYISGTARPVPSDAAPVPAEPIARHPSPDGSTLGPASPVHTGSTATPSTLHQARLVTPEAEPRREKVTLRVPPAAVPTPPAAEARKPVAPAGSWMIQIGATDDMTKAQDLLARARLEGRKALGNAQPFTEKVQKGSGTLYRARFAGLEAETAELACKTLKRSGFDCFATRN